MRIVTCSLTLLILTFCLVAFGGIDDGLIAHFPFDGNADDATGHGNDGVVSGAILTTDRFGNPNSAYLFSDPYDRIDTPPLLGDLATNSFTISMWVEQVEQITGNQPRLYEQGDGDVHPAVQLIMDQRPGLSDCLRAQLNETAGGEFVWVSFGTCFGHGTPLGWAGSQEWHHVAYVFETGTSTISIFVDGSISDSDSFSFPDIDLSSFPSTIGNNNAVLPADAAWNGRIDEVRIYDRALNEQEVRSLYDLTPSTVFDPPRVLAYYFPVLETAPGFNWLDHIPWLSLSHLSHAFFQPHSDGTVSDPNGILNADLIQKAHLNGVRVLASVGGGGNPAATAAFVSISENPDLQEDFADNLYTLVTDHGYDGVDIDWEFPEDQQQGVGLENLIEAIRQRFEGTQPTDFPEWTIAIAIGNDASYFRHLNFDALNNAVTFYNVMTYDYYYWWNEDIETTVQLAGHNAPLFFASSAPGTQANRNIFEALDYLLNEGNVPKEKVNLGLPFYGVEFPSATSLYDDCGQSCPFSSKAYWKLRDEYNLGDFQWDNGAKVPYLDYSDQDPGVVSFDNNQSLMEKVNFAFANKGLGGIFIWEISEGWFGPSRSQSLFDAVEEAILVYSNAPFVDGFESGESTSWSSTVQ
jgi:GH18 family chitinase